MGRDHFHSAYRSGHPGGRLRERLKSLGRSRTEIAQLLGISRQTLYDVLNERQSVTPAIALRLAKLTGTSAEMWLQEQLAHDLRQARKEMHDVLDGIPALELPW